MKYNTLFLLALLLSNICQAQSPEYLKIGDTVPDVVFQDKANFPASINRMSDLKGKLIILDFWSTGCASCIAAFPKMEKLQDEFDGKIQVILVNAWESGEKIHQRISSMKRYSPEYGLSTLPSINGDKRWKELFYIRTVPHHVWVDADGKVVYITDGYNATKEHVQAVLDGQKPELGEKDDTEIKPRQLDRESLRNKAEATDQEPRFYSAIFPYQSSLGGGVSITPDTLNGLKRESYKNSSIVNLYEHAVYHDLLKVHRKPLIESENKVDLIHPKDGNGMDAWQAKNLYSYEIQVPMSMEDRIPAIMLQDLNRFFGAERGIVGGLERRVISCYVLKGGNPDLLKTKHPETEGAYTIENGIHQWTNAPFGVFANKLSQLYEDMALPRAFINEAVLDKSFKVDLALQVDDLADTLARNAIGARAVDDLADTLARNAIGARASKSFKVDLALQVDDLADFAAVQKALKAYGLELVQESRELEVIVIRDKL